MFKDFVKFTLARLPQIAVVVVILLTIPDMFFG